MLLQQSLLLREFSEHLSSQESPEWMEASVLACTCSSSVIMTRDNCLEMKQSTAGNRVEVDANALLSTIQFLVNSSGKFMERISPVVLACLGYHLKARASGGVLSNCPSLPDLLGWTSKLANMAPLLLPGISASLTPLIEAALRSPAVDSSMDFKHHTNDSSALLQQILALDEEVGYPLTLSDTRSLLLQCMDLVEGPSSSLNSPIPSPGLQPLTYAASLKQSQLLLLISRLLRLASNKHGLKGRVVRPSSIQDLGGDEDDEEEFANAKDGGYDSDEDKSSFESSRSHLTTNRTGVEGELDYIEGVTPPKTPPETPPRNSAEESIRKASLSESNISTGRRRFRSTRSSKCARTLVSQLDLERLEQVGFWRIDLALVMARAAEWVEEGEEQVGPFVAQEGVYRVEEVFEVANAAIKVLSEVVTAYSSSSCERLGERLATLLISTLEGCVVSAWQREPACLALCRTSLAHAAHLFGSQLTNLAPETLPRLRKLMVQYAFLYQEHMHDTHSLLSHTISGMCRIAAGLWAEGHHSAVKTFVYSLGTTVSSEFDGIPREQEAAICLLGRLTTEVSSVEVTEIALPMLADVLTADNLTGNLAASQIKEITGAMTALAKQNKTAYQEFLTGLIRLYTLPFIARSSRQSRPGGLGGGGVPVVVPSPDSTGAPGGEGTMSSALPSAMLHLAHSIQEPECVGDMLRQLLLLFSEMGVLAQRDLVTNPSWEVDKVAACLGDLLPAIAQACKNYMDHFQPIGQLIGTTQSSAAHHDTVTLGGGGGAWEDMVGSMDGTPSHKTRLARSMSYHQLPGEMGDGSTPQLGGRAVKMAPPQGLSKLLRNLWLYCMLYELVPEVNREYRWPSSWRSSLEWIALATPALVPDSAHHAEEMVVELEAMLEGLHFGYTENMHNRLARALLEDLSGGLVLSQLGRGSLALALTVLQLEGVRCQAPGGRLASLLAYLGGLEAQGVSTDHEAPARVLLLTVKRLFALRIHHLKEHLHPVAGVESEADEDMCDLLVGLSSAGSPSACRLLEDLLTDMLDAFPHLYWSPVALSTLLQLAYSSGGGGDAGTVAALLGPHCALARVQKQWLSNIALEAPDCAKGVMEAQLQPVRGGGRLPLQYLGELLQDLLGMKEVQGTGGQGAGEMRLGMAEELAQLSIKAHYTGQVAALKIFGAKRASGRVGERALVQQISREFGTCCGRPVPSVLSSQQSPAEPWEAGGVNKESGGDTLFRAAALVLSHAQKSAGCQQGLLTLLAWAPTKGLRVPVIRAASTAWTWILSAEPSLTSLLMSEILGAFTWTVDAKLGMLASVPLSTHLHPKLLMAPQVWSGAELWENIGSKEEKRGGKKKDEDEDEDEALKLANVYQGILAHSTWLSFLYERWQVMRTFCSGELAALMVRLLQRALQDPFALCRHPLAVGPTFQLLHLTLTVASDLATSQLERSAQAKRAKGRSAQDEEDWGLLKYVMLRDNVMTAALWWFACPPGWLEMEGWVVEDAIQALDGFLVQLQSRVLFEVLPPPPCTTHLPNPTTQRGSFPDSKDRRNQLLQERELLMELCQHELARLRLWAQPTATEWELKKLQKAKATAKAKAKALIRKKRHQAPLPDWPGVFKMTKTEDWWGHHLQVAWRVAPQVALSLATRFPELPYLQTQLSRLVCQHAHLGDVQRIPSAVRFLVSPHAVARDAPELSFLNQWAPACIADLMTLLQKEVFKHPAVAAYVRRALDSHPEDQVMFFLPQLVQALRCDTAGRVEEYMLGAARRSPLFAHRLVWVLGGEEPPPPPEELKSHVKRSGFKDPWKTPNDLWKIVPRVIQRVRDEMGQSADSAAADFFRRESALFDAVTSISGILKPLAPEQRRAKIAEQLKLIEVEGLDLYLPTNPSAKVVSINTESGRPLQSAAKVPIMVTFNVHIQNHHHHHHHQEEEEQKYHRNPQKDPLTAQSTAASYEVEANGGGTPAGPAGSSEDLALVSGNGNAGGGGESSSHAAVDANTTTTTTTSSSVVAVPQALIFKVGDDCRQDVLALQIIDILRGVWKAAELDLYVFPYGVIPTGYERGIIEVVPNSYSRNELGQQSDGGMLEMFTQLFGNAGSHTFEKARQNFISSSAGYAIASFLLLAKDRHNGNLLIDKQGHLVHIDFGFIFEISPGGNIGFESARFKLSHEMTQLLDPGGRKRSSHFLRFMHLCIQGYLVARQHMEQILAVVGLMVDSGLPCFGRGRPLRNLRKRFHPELSNYEAAAFMKATILDAYDKWSTRGYDLIQYLQQGITH